MAASKALEGLIQTSAVAQSKGERSVFSYLLSLTALQAHERMTWYMGPDSTSPALEDPDAWTSPALAIARASS